MNEFEEDPKAELERKRRGWKIVGGLTDEEVEKAKARGRQRAEDIRREVRSWPSKSHPDGRPIDEE